MSTLPDLRPLLEARSVGKSGLMRAEDSLELGTSPRGLAENDHRQRRAEARKSGASREFVSHSINRLINIGTPLCDWSARLELRAAGNPIESPSPNLNAATP
jgi:hypothetical protein